MSAVLVREEEGQQHPVYYVSRSLLDAEKRYPQLEKLALSLVMASRKLKSHFKSHNITAVTSFLIKNVLTKPDISGRLAKWDIKLREYDLIYELRTAIKSQVLADFITYFSVAQQIEAKKEMSDISNKTLELWTLLINDSSNSKGSGLGIVLTSPQGTQIERPIRCGFKTTNNEAEYEQFLAGLTLAKELKIKTFVVKSDSQLIVN